jgi:hypothetical protein
MRLRSLPDKKVILQMKSELLFLFLFWTLIRYHLMLTKYSWNLKLRFLDFTFLQNTTNETDETHPIPKALINNDHNFEESF